MNERLIQETLGSVALKGNALGDPRLRKVPVYLPPSYFTSKTKRYPVVYYLVGFSGTSTVESHPWKENWFERHDRLVAEGVARESILVVPDCFTSLGGSQYMDSPAVGDYETHIADELVGYIDSKYRTTGTVGGRAVMGKSSGGIGALRLAMRHPDLFGHAVSHSGDMLFEACYTTDFLKSAAVLHRFKGGFAGFYKEFRAARDKYSFPFELINIAGMSACYSPSKSRIGFDLPFDEKTGETIDEVFGRWLAHDPVRMAPLHQGALKGLTTLFFDAGRKDEFFLQLGARKFSQVLKGLKIKHTYEEHEKGHFDMKERLDAGFAALAKGFKKARV